MELKEHLSVDGFPVEIEIVSLFPSVLILDLGQLSLVLTVQDDVHVRVPTEAQPEETLEGKGQTMSIKNQLKKDLRPKDKQVQSK